MSYWDYKWRPYVSQAERMRKAAEMAKLKKKGHPVAPVVLARRTIASTFWGKAWCDSLEAYGDYANRLPRGRTYVRNGSVVDLQIAEAEISARQRLQSLQGEGGYRLYCSDHRRTAQATFCYH